MGFNSGLKGLSVLMSTQNTREPWI